MVPENSSFHESHQLFQGVQSSWSSCLSVVTGLLFTNFPVPDGTNWALFVKGLKV